MMMTNLPHLQRKQENFHHQKVLNITLIYFLDSGKGGLLGIKKQI